MKAGDRVRTALGWEGTLLGFVEFSTGEQRAAVQLDDISPAGPGTNFYPPHLLTLIGEPDDTDAAGNPAGNDARH